MRELCDRFGFGLIEVENDEISERKSGFQNVSVFDLERVAVEKSCKLVEHFEHKILVDAGISRLDGQPRELRVIYAVERAPRQKLHEVSI